MANEVRIYDRPDVVEYRNLVKGDLFKSRAPCDEQNIYIKVGTKAVNLRTGEEYSYDQDKPVSPLPKGTVISIKIGEGR